MVIIVQAKQKTNLLESSSSIPDVLVHEHRSRQRVSEGMGTLQYGPLITRPLQVRYDAHLIGPGRKELE